MQVLSHRDELGPALNEVRERFGSRLACSELEVSAVSAEAEPDLIGRTGLRRSGARWA